VCACGEGRDWRIWERRRVGGWEIGIRRIRERRRVGGRER